jgi:ComF family protein
VGINIHLRPVGRSLLEFLFPSRCVGCGEEGTFLCADCRGALPSIQSPFCNICGRPLSPGEPCPDCRRWQLEINGIRAPFRFEGVIRDAIHKLKYHHFRALAPSLAGLLAGYLEVRPLAADVLVPVPIHSRRLRERGYNQSALLAKELSKLVAIPVVEDCLFRSKNTSSQTKADAQTRRRNVSGAFLCRDRRLEGQRVLIVDDVCTTGATLDSCAVALRRGGASLVWGLTVARET